MIFFLYFAQKQISSYADYSDTIFLLFLCNIVAAASQKSLKLLVSSSGRVSFSISLSLCHSILSFGVLLSLFFIPRCVPLLSITNDPLFSLSTASLLLSPIVYYSHPTPLPLLCSVSFDLLPCRVRPVRFYMLLCSCSLPSTTHQITSKIESRKVCMC